jgi:hypothetical protein
VIEIVDEVSALNGAYFTRFSVAEQVYNIFPNRRNSGRGFCLEPAI